MRSDSRFACRQLIILNPTLMHYDVVLCEIQSAVGSMLSLRSCEASSEPPDENGPRHSCRAQEKLVLCERPRGLWMHFHELKSQVWAPQNEGTCWGFWRKAKNSAWADRQESSFPCRDKRVKSATFILFGSVFVCVDRREILILEARLWNVCPFAASNRWRPLRATPDADSGPGSPDPQGGQIQTLKMLPGKNSHCWVSRCKQAAQTQLFLPGLIRRSGCGRPHGDLCIHDDTLWGPLSTWRAPSVHMVSCAKFPHVALRFVCNGKDRGHNVL